MEIIYKYNRRVLVPVLNYVGNQTGEKEHFLCDGIRWCTCDDCTSWEPGGDTTFNISGNPKDGAGQAWIYHTDDSADCYSLKFSKSISRRREILKERYQRRYSDWVYTTCDKRSANGRHENGWFHLPKKRRNTPVWARVWQRENLRILNTTDQTYAERLDDWGKMYEFRKAGKLAEIDKKFDLCNGQRLWGRRLFCAACVQRMKNEHKELKKLGLANAIYETKPKRGF